MFKTTFSDNAMERTQTSEWFSQLKSSVEDCVQFFPPQVAEKKACRKFAKLSRKTDKVPL
jgi:hypothetical protein